MQALFTLLYLAITATIGLAIYALMYAMLLLIIKACLVVMHHLDMRPRSRYYRMEARL